MLIYSYLEAPNVENPLKYHITIIGGGILGLSTAYSLLQARPGMKLLLLEKEPELARHQTGNNSGVIHSGLYYKPGSLKAENCVKGYDKMLSFCDNHGIAYEICGKIVVATKTDQLPLLNTLHNRGVQNGLSGLVPIPSEELSQYEPHVVGKAGLWVPQTGIIDYMDVANTLADLIRESGGEIKLGKKVTDIISGETTEVITQDNAYQTNLVVSCAGLYSDQVTRLTEPQLDVRILPFRGEYYQLKPEKEYLVKNLIYPVPDPNFPFLGVHFTRMIKGGIEAGPNAILALAKEGYRKSDIKLKELIDILAWPGFQKVAFKYWDKGLGEMYRSFSKQAFTKALQQLVPDITERDLEPGGAGVRAQASSRDGRITG